MKTLFYISDDINDQGKKVSRKKVTEMCGAENVKRYVQEAKEEFAEDPFTDNVRRTHGKWLRVWFEP